MTVETGYKHIVQTPGFYEGRPCIDNYKTLYMILL